MKYQFRALLRLLHICFLTLFLKVRQKYYMFFLLNSSYSVMTPSEEQARRGLKLASDILYAGHLVKQETIPDPASISDAIPILREILCSQFPEPSPHHEVKMLGRLIRNSVSQHKILCPKGSLMSQYHF